MVNNIKYPDAAVEKQVTGKLIADFVVELDGSMSSVKLINELGYGLEEEVLRVLSLLPAWQPALNKKGEPMRVRMQIPLTLEPPKIKSAQNPVKMKPNTKGQKPTAKPAKSKRSYSTPSKN
jgi:hypothetical protein